jgi:hypothetical protein
MKFSTGDFLHRGKTRSSTHTHTTKNLTSMRVETCPDFFLLQEYTTKSTMKILAAKTHCKYFLKIAEVTHFSVRRTACIRGLYNPS